MPWYDFECTKCSAMSTLFRCIEERDESAVCSECLAPAERALSVPAVIVRKPMKDVFPDVDGNAMKEQEYEWED